MSAFIAGFSLSLSLIFAIGPQNAHVLRMGLTQSHLGITVLACAGSDIILIAIGVLGFSKVSELSSTLHSAILVAALLFLLLYGYKAATRAINDSHRSLNPTQANLPDNTKQAALAALAFSWLNPHAWLDTTVLIGSASLLYETPKNYAFGIGAATASACWFFALAFVASWFAPHLKSPAIWRVIDAVVALTMWGTAAWLAFTLVTSIPPKRDALERKFAPVQEQKIVQ